MALRIPTNVTTHSGDRDRWEIAGRWQVDFGQSGHDQSNRRSQ